MGRLTLLLSRELDLAVDALRDREKRRTNVDLPDAIMGQSTCEEPEGPLGMFFELSDQASQASAKHPREAKRLREMLKAIEVLARESSNPSFRMALQAFRSMCRRMNTMERDSPALTVAIDHYTMKFERAIHERGLRIQNAQGEGPDGNGHFQVTGTKADEHQNGQIKLRVQEITKRDFVERVVLPYLFNLPSEERLPNWKAAVVHEIDTGRATVSYRFGGKALMFGKLYSDEAQAQHSFQVQKELWNLGFDKGGLYQVPEPLAYLHPYRLELMRIVEGRELSTLFDEQHPELCTYARQAARWLVKLHRSPLRIGRPETLWQSMWFCKILRRLVKASAALPDFRNEFVDMVDILCDMGERTFRQMPTVQAHGTFHYEHILVDGPITSVIDFDRSFPSDPAKDLAEFLSFLRWRTFLQTESVRLAERPARAFLEEYIRYLPENSTNLALHWGSNVLRTFFWQAQHDPRDDSSNAKLRFLRDEFESIVSGKVLGELGTKGG